MVWQAHLVGQGDMRVSTWFAGGAYFNMCAYMLSVQCVNSCVITRGLNAFQCIGTYTILCIL